MKKAIFLWCLLSLQALGAQHINSEIIAANGQPFLVGKITIKGLQQPPYNSWYTANLENYEVDESLTPYLKPKLQGIDILLFLGTWCGDSKRQVPRFIKILEATDFDMERLQLVALDRRKEFFKKSPTGEEKGLSIIKVPTIIFYKNGQEINRIVERPIDSLEEDMWAILNGQEYLPNYSK